jgi:hypothetical protein
VCVEKKDKVTKVIHNQGQTNTNQDSAGKESIKNKAFGESLMPECRLVQGYQELKYRYRF